MSTHFDEDIIILATKLQSLGAKNVLVSLAENGAILLTHTNDIYKLPAPKGKVISSVGSGDSMIAGFIYAYLKEHNYKYALKYAICSGSATAFTNGIATKTKVESLLAFF